METFKFKTTIQCGGCVAAVTPYLNKIEGIGNWEVDIQNPNKILTVETENVPAGQLIAAIKNAGYKAELI